MPPRPPRRPTTSGSRPRRPRGRRDAEARCARRSHLPDRGAATSTGSSRIEPWGGDRPTGSRSRTGSRTSRSPKRSMRAGTRSANCVRRAGPVTVTRATAARPISADIGLRSIASSRSAPHHDPRERQADGQQCGTVLLAAQHRGRPRRRQARARSPRGHGRRWLMRCRRRARQAGGGRGRRASRSRHHQVAKLFDGRRTDPARRRALRPTGRARAAW